MSQHNGDSRALAAKLKARGLGITHTRMRQNSQNPHSAPLRRTNREIALEDPIKGFCVFPALAKPKGPCKHIKYDVSLVSLVKDNMEEFEANFGNHTLGLSSYIDKSEGEYSRMKRYFNRCLLYTSPSPRDS